MKTLRIIAGDRHARALMIILMLIFFGSNSFAANGAVTYLGIEQGLSNNAVTSIYQDKDSFLWFGTYDGLNRYDGYEFKIFRNITGDTTSLSSYSINAIEGDRYHNMRVAALNGVNIYNPIKSDFLPRKYLSFDSHTLLPIKGDVHILKATIGNMLVGAQQSGLIIYEKNAETGIQIPLEVNGRRQINYKVSAIEFDSLVNIVWVFIQDKRLYKYNQNKRV